jgi:hypothetical protein
MSTPGWVCWPLAGRGRNVQGILGEVLGAPEGACSVYGEDVRHSRAAGPTGHRAYIMVFPSNCDVACRPGAKHRCRGVPGRRDWISRDRLAEVLAKNASKAATRPQKLGPPVSQNTLPELVGSLVLRRMVP